MKQLLTLLLILFTIPLSAQTYFFVNSLEIIPEAPTSVDEIFIQVSGDFSNTGSYITGHSVILEQGTVDLTIDCASQGGLTILVPHDTTFSIGSELIPGDYTIDLSGIGLGDFVTDPSMYEFTVQEAQGLDEVLREQVTWNYQFGNLSVHNGTSHTLSIKVFDLKGRQLHVQENISLGRTGIDLKLSQGYYLLEMKVEGVQWREKFFAD